MSELVQISVRPVARHRRALLHGRDLGAFRFSSKLERNLVRKAGEVIGAFDLISRGDVVMVCVSGGKDSYALLDVLQLLQRRSPVPFELLAVNVDQGWPGYDTASIKAHLEREGVPYRMEHGDFAHIVEDKLRPGQTPCTLCSRFRRGYLYDLADRVSASLGGRTVKIALGHHADDAIETLMLNLMFSGRLASMPPRMTSEDGHVVIRPLAYVTEAETREYAVERDYPLVRCGCLSCGLPDQKRQVVKRLLGSLELESPGTKQQMLAAMHNVQPSHLMDTGLLARLASGQALAPVSAPDADPSADGIPQAVSVHLATGESLAAELEPIPPARAMAPPY
jgi:tRNA 2-thiocytidine biosynthesis protein TtcA